MVIFLSVLGVLLVLLAIVELVYGRKLSKISMDTFLHGFGLSGWIAPAGAGETYGRRGKQKARALRASANDWLLAVCCLGIIVPALGAALYIVLHPHEYDPASITWASDLISGIVAGFLGIVVGRLSKP